MHHTELMLMQVQNIVYMLDNGGQALVLDLFDSLPNAPQ